MGHRVTPPVPEGGLPPIADQPDTTGELWRDYTTVPMAPLVAAGGALAVPVAGLVLTGRRMAALGALAGSVAACEALYAVAAFAAKQFLGAPHTTPLTPQEQAFVQVCPDRSLAEPYERTERIGRMLTGIAPDTFEAYYRALTPEQVETIKVNRAAEAEATWEWMRGLDERIVCIQAEDGEPLAGHVFVTDASSTRWAVVAHGYFGAWNEMSHYARHWAELGYNLLLPEMRGHGTSGGDTVGMGWLDRRDLAAWLRWLLAEEGSDLRIMLHGHSMGGASVLLAAAEADLPSQVVGVVSDCAYSDTFNTFAPILRDGFGVPPAVVLPLVRLAVMRRKGGYDLAQASPEQAAPRIAVPVLLFHGERDTFVPPYMARRIEAALPEGSKRLVMVPGASHCQACLADPVLYWDEVRSFVEAIG